MQIVLPGALPDGAIAQTLAPHMEEKAPHFTGWLRHAQAQLIPAKPAETFCTPYEYWLLRRHDYQAGPGERPSAGLAALLAAESGKPADPDAPLWLGQLVHIAPARDGAALIPAGELEISSEENAALYESAAEYFTGAGFALAPFDTTHWRIVPPHDYRPECASPALVSISSVNDWWKQDTEGRAWRRLVNELQMLWFDHPVNQAREARGLRPVNSLWLYGGASLNRLTARTSPAETKVLRNLQGPCLVQDWGSWLHELERLDREEFARLPDMPELVLTGSDRIVELSPARRSLIKKLLGGKQDWRRWWSAHN